ncbi:type IV pilin protein [Pseudomonas nitroreducens]|uniref:Type IV pilin protein n=1 Tax=Pseudomonas nitroreducens TaxID=46680 RepID=A0A6G6IS97_PSENT|nr:type IV pilin protein [Pseudomonas nitroreducens]MBG6287139.1 type IV pilin protein [Pseudomonas nitroreducens]NMZ61946.1 type IV pilin protein [Pseudomonas nitroreducens]QIE85690.1 type IV pilin protein [Pseudomonas nitroreducens]WEX00168.1 type IV pilin protein [Pseudomonas nitroreducens]SNT21087.1 type IV pilus assembly protein PilE [Pseudomonas nitroreducens]
MKRSNGFTLIEMMIVLVIISILAAFAVPGYQSYITRNNRAEGQALLTDAAARQERFFSQNNQYATTTAQLGLASANSRSNVYQLQIARPSNTTYTLSAVPINKQAADRDCATYTLDQDGLRAITGRLTVADCWR